MTQEQILSIFKETGALLEGHFQLTSGLHSQQYFQCAKVLQYPRHTTKLCARIADHFSRSAVDVVITPAIGGIVVGQEVGRVLNVRTVFAERKDGALQLRRGFELSRGERVLVCEDVVTTGGSVFEVIDIVGSHSAVLAGVGFIVDRSGGSVRFPVEKESDQFALLQMAVQTFAPATCPMCNDGLQIMKPGSRGNK
ncbi:MAG TPA: orotate phosphoribosyltransferase [Bacteroidota bacterium]